MPLHPSLQAMLAKTADDPPLHTLPIAEARARVRLGYLRNVPPTAVAQVHDLRIPGLADERPARVYVPFVNMSGDTPDFLVARTKGSPEDLADPIRRIVARIDPEQPVSAIRTMDDIVDLDVADRQQQMVLLGAFASLALLLASIGLYGVLSYAVTQRSREIGLRIALGATAGSVMRAVVARGLALTGIGLTIGLALAWAGTRALQNVLYGVAAGDPSTYAAVVALLSAIALLASYLPAHRAARVDPMAVLRAD